MSVAKNAKVIDGTRFRNDFYGSVENGSHVATNETESLDGIGIKQSAGKVLAVFEIDVEKLIVYG